jgi:hypothetical protein
LGILQAFIGLGGIAGGVGLIADPSGGNVGMSVEALAGTPFGDYLIPGLVLLTVNGLGSLAGSVMTFRRSHLAAEVAIGLGAFLLVWIVSQVYWIGLVHWLQPLYFGFGVLELGLGYLLRRLRPQFN